MESYKSKSLILNPLGPLMVIALIHKVYLYNNPHTYSAYTTIGIYDPQGFKSLNPHIPKSHNLILIYIYNIRARQGDLYD